MHAICRMPFEGLQETEAGCVPLLSYGARPEPSIAQPEPRNARQCFRRYRIASRWPPSRNQVPSRSQVLGNGVYVASLQFDHFRASLQSLKRPQKSSDHASVQGAPQPGLSGPSQVLQVEGSIGGWRAGRLRSWQRWRQWWPRQWWPPPPPSRHTSTASLWPMCRCCAAAAAAAAADFGPAWIPVPPLFPSLHSALPPPATLPAARRCSWQGAASTPATLSRTASTCWRWSQTACCTTSGGDLAAGPGAGRQRGSMWCCITACPCLRLPGSTPAAQVNLLLNWCRKTAGLPAPGASYGGWEWSGVEIRGHFVGHYLSALALATLHSGAARQAGTPGLALKLAHTAQTLASQHACPRMLHRRRHSPIPAAERRCRPGCGRLLPPQGAPSCGSAAV